MSNLIKWMRQKFQLNATFTLYTNFDQNIKLGGPASYSLIFAAFNFANAFCYNVKCSEAAT